MKDLDKPTLTPAQQALLKKKLSNFSLSKNTGITAIKKYNYQEFAPLSAGQKRLWYMNMLEPNSGVYNVPMTFRLGGFLDFEILEKSFQCLLDRHESLRTEIIQHNNEPAQHILSALKIQLEKIDLSQLTGDQKQHELDSLIENLWSKPFDIASAPLWRVSLIQLSKGEAILCMVFYHVIFDGWSGDIVLRELAVIYSDLIQGDSSDAEGVSLQYADYCFWQQERLNSPEIQQQMEYWVRHIGSGPLTVLQMPTDFPRPNIQSYQGASVSGFIGSTTIESLATFAREENATLFMVLLAVYALLLGRYSTDKEILIALPVAGRTLNEWESMVGYFANTLVLRVELGEELNFRALLKQVRESSIAAFENADLPFDQLVEKLNPVRDMSRTPIFQTLFGFRAQTQETNSMAEVSVEPAVFKSKLSQTDISIWLDQREKGIDISIEYCTALFRDKSIEDLLSYFLFLTKHVVASAELNIHDIPLIDTLENSAASGFSMGKIIGEEIIYKDEDALNEQSFIHCIHSNALLKPNATAVMFRDESLSYQRLDEVSSQLAHFLDNKGVSKGDCVGLCVERSQNMLVALLGILKLGASYVPLDPDFPAERLIYMVNDSGLQHLVTQKSLSVNLPNVEYVYFLDDVVSQLSGFPATIPKVEIEKDTPAYIIYTSGSTGKPKGVVVQHSAIYNFLNSMAVKPGFNQDDVMLAVTTLSFDIAVLELYLPLFCGGSVVIADKRDSTDGRRLLEMLDTCVVSCMQATPATWRLLISCGWQKSANPIRALCGGEALPVDLAEQLITRTDELWNMYGPTETTVWSSCALVEQPLDAASIGKPIANTSLFVLDKLVQVVPRGFEGELYIGGAGVTLGYHNRQELNAVSFIQSPFNSDERIYKTGDKVRMCSDGSIEYLGRFDQQVKVRGYRIELGEIETLLRRHDEIDDCALVVREIQGGDVRLVAFVVWHDNPITMTETRQFLSKNLPQYMIPQQLESIDALPRTANNKLDRKALQEKLIATTVERQRHEPPVTAEEKWLAKLWKDLTGVDMVGRHDNFFDIGGHSLLSMQLLYRISEERGITLSPRDILLENMNKIALMITESSADKELSQVQDTIKAKLSSEEAHKKSIFSNSFFSKWKNPDRK